MESYFGYVKLSYNDNFTYVNFTPLYAYDEENKLEKCDYNKVVQNSPFHTFSIRNYKGKPDARDFVSGEMVFVLNVEIKPISITKNRKNYAVDITDYSKQIKRPYELNFYPCIDSDMFISDYKTNDILKTNLSIGTRIVIKDKSKKNKLLGPFIVLPGENKNSHIIDTEIRKNNFLSPGYVCKNDLNQFSVNIEVNSQKYEYYEINKEHFEKTTIDCLDAEGIIDSFVDAFKYRNLLKRAEDPDKKNDVMKVLIKNSLVDINISRNILDQRLDYIINVFKSLDILEEKFDLLLDITKDFIYRCQDDEVYSKFLKRLSNDEKFMKHVPEYNAIISRIELLKENRDTLELECMLKNDEKEKLNIEIKETNDKLKETEAAYNNFFTLDDDEKIRKAFDFKIDNIFYNRILEKVLNIENKQITTSYYRAVEEIQKLDINKKENTELVEYLVSKIKYYRPEYSKNDIINILICIFQGFITVFSGEPGTGKTSICKILANVLGLNMPSKKIDKNTIKEIGCTCDRFVNISVERGWTTKRDFIGYYNPLTKTFDKSHKTLFDALNILDIEADENKTSLPFFIMLDEANLSPMEYYWADYMNICDDLGPDSSIDLGENYSYRVPKNLRFLATINNDHTTEPLSPRLIDRAWIIRLPRVRIESSVALKFAGVDFDVLGWDDLAEAFGCSNDDIKFDTDVRDIYSKIENLMLKLNIDISNRVLMAIKKYWFTGKKLFDKVDNRSSSLIALDYAIAQRVLPQINGTGAVYKDNLKEISFYCKEKKLFISEAILNSIIQKAGDEMYYYHYFA